LRTLSFIALLALFLSSPVMAQGGGFALDRFQPAPTSEDGVALVLPRTLGHLRPAFGLTLDYAHQPLVISRPGQDPDSAPVEHRLLGHVTAALGLGSRFELFVRAPVLLVQRGDTQNAGIISAGLPDASTFGTLFAGAGLRLLGEDDGPLSLGVTGWVEAPTGSEKSLTGDDGVGAGGLLTGAANTHVLSFAVNVGGRYRPKQDYGSSRIGSELLLGAGAYARAGEYVTLLGELTGAIYLRDWGEVTTNSSPFEVLLGLRCATPIKLLLTGAVGLGLTHAIGVPDVRGILQFAYPTPRSPLRASDLDHDGIPDDRDHCPERPEDRDNFQDGDGCPDLDNDKDGIADATDRCVNEAEDLDGIEDDNGCPDPDNDQDGIIDSADQCPNAPEDRDGFQDSDGCPDLDNDKDGLLDLRDQCPSEPEDSDGFADEDGCPDFDNDKDGVIDTEDGCPTVPGPAETRGCPSAVRIDKAQIRILERIEFQTKRAEVRPESLGILDQVRAAFEANPQIKRVRIEGHTDARGPTLSNARLSQRRAEAVMRYLVREGIDPNRLEAKGWGEERPLVKNDTAANMQANRRVEFHIVDPAPNSAGGGQ
jgi:outer membrane protein OmpA-like peptidoglycan-associated protein